MAESCARCELDELKQLLATLNRHDLSPHHRLALARVTVRKLIARSARDNGAGEGLSDHFLAALKDAEGKLRIETAMRQEAE